ncbi:DUF1254 domain-containing protein [Caballeronia humi]|uniref:Lipoprotein n=1 Tax=Caballeronia humi TaxID=326474 RepID=A0A158IM14_9BURK|nr:DUF1214 domain-containing protein [Caballeronia humi]SAL57090.1 putative lipoprotein [Caballeronia humi]
MKTNRRWAFTFQPVRSAVCMAAFAGAAALLAGCASHAPQPKTSGGWLKDQVADAYTFGFPLVASDVARERAAGGDGTRPGQAPLNTLRHASALPPVGVTGAPSVDTLESTAWLDVAKEPVLVSLPAAPRGRYYDARAFDAWTNVLYSSAERAPYPKAQTIAFVPAGWKGTLPSGVLRIEAPTRYVWLSIRVRVNGPRDVREARKLQTAMQVDTLSGAPRAAPDPAAATSGAWSNAAADHLATPATASSPAEQAETFDANTFFARLAHALDDNPPSAEDAHEMSQLAELGVVPGEQVQFRKRDAALLATGLADGRERLATVPSNAISKNGWTWFGDSVGKYGADYTLRAYLARRDPGTATKESEVKPVARVDSDDHPLNGANTYVLHFAPNQLPPVRGFWTLTAYTKDGALVEGKVPRLSLSDRDKLKKNRDGSIDVVVSEATPAKGLASNWLPVPGGDFQLVMRLYAPKPQAADGTWAPPVVQRQ